MQDVICDILVVGAGPAGLLSAISAASKGDITSNSIDKSQAPKVILCDQLPTFGRKILASGGGRCNLSNLADLEDYPAQFGKNGRFIMPALYALSPEYLCYFFESAGVEISSEGLRVYPKSNKATEILSALKSKCAQLGIKILTNSQVSKLLLKDDQSAPKCIGAKLTTGQNIKAKSIIIATGGKSYPELGATGSGYDLANSAGHKIVTPLPAGVGLITIPNFPNLAGTHLPNANIRIALPRESKAGTSGEILFSHRGITGPAILDISSKIARLIENKSKPIPIEIQIIAGKTPNDWRNILDSWRENSGKTLLVNLLRREISANLAKFFCEKSGISSSCQACQISAKARDSLCENLGKLKLNASKTEGFNKAFVTAGGVNLKQVNPQTLESKLVPGLFFAGEILDLDGKCGGFNLQWAFSSGFLAGLSAVEFANS